MQAKQKEKHAGGRPPKFTEPSQPVTVTLPTRTLDKLARLHPDRAKAIVKAVDALSGAALSVPRVEVTEVAPATSLLVVPANRSLRKLPWLQLLEVAPGRYIIAINTGTAIEKVEIGLLDLIADARVENPEEIPMLESLRDALNELRRGQLVTKAEILVVNNKASRPDPSAG